jgi:hypothetical protein
MGFMSWLITVYGMSVTTWSWLKFLRKSEKDT